jgi:putative transposase
VALPARALRDLDRGLGPVAALALEQRLGAGDGAPRGDRPGTSRPRAASVDGLVDAQTVKGGRYGPTFHEAGGRGGRTIGTKRTLLVEILGLPLAARADSARPHDVVVARELLRDRPVDLSSVREIVGDRAYRGLAGLNDRKHVRLDIKAPPPGASGFVPIRPLYRIEHAFAQLGRWRRLSRCYEGTEASARAWLEVASVGYLTWRAAA